MSCEAVQERLSELALAHRLGDAPAGDRAHADGCDACATHLRFLGELDAVLESLPAPALPRHVVDRSRLRATRALRARERPVGLVRQLVPTFALALLALPVVVLHAWLVVQGAAALLGPLVPDALLVGMAAVYLGSLALAVGALYGCIPLAVAFARRPRTEPA